MLERRLIRQAGVIGEPTGLNQTFTSVSRPRAPIVRFQGDAATSTNSLSIGSLSDFFGALRDVNSVASSTVLKQGFNGDGTVVSYVKQCPQNNHETTAMALASAFAEPIRQSLCHLPPTLL
jgi:hypothetical protein